MNDEGSFCLTKGIGQIHVQSALPSILCYCYSIMLILIYSTPRSCFPLPLFIQVLLAQIICQNSIITLDIQFRGVLPYKIDLGAHLYYILGGKTWYCSTTSLGAFTMETGRGRKYLFLPLTCRKRMQLILFKKENEFRPPCGRVCLPVV